MAASAVGVVVVFVVAVVGHFGGGVYSRFCCLVNKRTIIGEANELAGCRVGMF